MSRASSDSVLQLIRRHLQSEMRRVREEIRNYPAPIPACDAQFNFLLAERDALTTELSRLRDLMEQGAVSKDPCSSVEAFLTMSTCLNDTVKNEIQASIENDNKRREGHR